MSNSYQNNNIELFKKTDDLIKAAHDYVRKNNVKVSAWEDLQLMLIGVQASDGNIFAGRLTALREDFTKSKIAKELIIQGVSVIDLINKQLLIFL
jgi:hypothetical protein